MFTYYLWFYVCLGERDRLVDLDVYGDNIKMDIQQARWREMGWIDVVQNRDRRRAFVNAVLYFRVSLNAGNFLSS